MLLDFCNFLEFFIMPLIWSIAVYWPFKYNYLDSLEVWRELSYKPMIQNLTKVSDPHLTCWFQAHFTNVCKEISFNWLHTYPGVQQLVNVFQPMGTLFLYYFYMFHFHL